MVFQRILVALDRSSQTETVFEQALAQVRSNIGSEHCHLKLVYVVRQEAEVPVGGFLGIGTIADMDTYGTLKRIQQEQIQRNVEKAKDWLQQYEQRALTQGVTTEIECKAGIPGVCLCELAQSWQADLIVIGRRGHQGLKEVVLGSVSNYVLHHAPCSVLVVQGMA